MSEQTQHQQDLFVGIDLGTSGCRAIAIDSDAHVIANLSQSWPAPDVKDLEVTQNPDIWWQSLLKLLSQLAMTIPTEQVRAICLDGTSGTVLLADEQGQPLGPALMYNDARASGEAQSLSSVAPAESAVHSASSGLAKLLWLKSHSDTSKAHFFLHQLDWMNGQLSGQYGMSDFNNALKTGFDSVQRKWPNWMAELAIPKSWLPEVVAPGTAIGTLKKEIAAEFGFAESTQLIAGTTDSTAAFMATGALQPGEAVTSLGSTLVIKILSEQAIFDADSGVYSQPCGDLWLVGGASNSGGKVLRDHFTDAQMKSMESQLNIEQPTGLDYYPLPQPGERFPVNDPSLSPRLTPRPDDEVMFFQAMLEGIAQIELKGYEKLKQLGAPWPSSIRTVGGGAKNTRWTTMRQNMLNVSLLKPENTDAAFGVAKLALSAIVNKQG
ncbi:MAG: FGGY-family carbohydrate kinase [Gammaproteobacteria bacterium]|nr:FGGY-family carbohydrate kinase [Gammaproteobacteria bacterium]